MTTPIATSKYTKPPIRICVLGPSFVGKTQLVNRFVNSSFYGEYLPTEEVQTYRALYSAKGQNQDDNYFSIEILDVFPHDHPSLYVDPSRDPEAKKLQEQLQKIVQNDYCNEPGDKLIKGFHGYIFVYDSHDKTSFEKLAKIIDVVKMYESSQRRGRKKEVVFYPKKLVLGNKKDVNQNMLNGLSKKEKVEALKKLECINLREVSALTNYEVEASFRLLIESIVSDPILKNQYKEYDKQSSAFNNSRQNSQFEDEKQNNTPQEALQSDRKQVKRQQFITPSASLKSKKETPGGGISGWLPFFCTPEKGDIDQDEDDDDDYGGENPDESYVNGKLAFTPDTRTHYFKARDGEQRDSQRDSLTSRQGLDRGTPTPDQKCQLF